MLVSGVLTIAYHVIVGSFGHVWPLHYFRRLPLPLFLLSVTVNLALLVGEHVQPLVDIPGGLWVQQHSLWIHLASLFTTFSFAYLVYLKVDVVRAFAGLLVVCLSDFVAFAVIPNAPAAYDCFEMTQRFHQPKGWTVYLW